MTDFGEAELAFHRGRKAELEVYERIAKNLMALHRDGGETQNRCATPQQAYLKAVEMYSARLQEQFDEGVKFAKGEA